jgi:cytochrome c oxidase cbb3-type subunit 3
MSEKKQISGWKRFMKSMTKANELGKEDEVMTDHDYDGIRELDNVLPPWWLYGFYITILISIFYIIQIFTNPEKYNQEMEYANEVEEAKEEMEAYILANPDLFNTENLETFTDAKNLAKGKELFTSKTCMACHLVDLGGSIGPNLTDEYWILGGDMSNIFNTISKGGRPGKGMIPWDSTISLLERQQLASYIISMQGTSPANPKAPEGDIIWKKQ